ncbi:MAG: peptidylprolyl isomerase [Bacteroidales bacterium]|jgi:peptidyl-prolyl cis-trans isomerase SurA
MKKILFGLVLVFSFSLLNAQERTILEIDDEKISAEEFLHIYKKNNTSDNAMTYEAMNEYMNLFVNFKLKVHEAKKLGLDTLASFKQELAGYRSQLAQPYLTDKRVEEELYLEAYERMKYDVEVSHILIKVNQNASPEDTLKAYKKIYDIYNKLKKGEDFVKLAREYSEDESVVMNDGNLGYRTVFSLVYDFENYMYITPVGSFSEPFRTRYGYHILKVTNKRPAKGKYKVAHIMRLVPKGSGTKLDEDARAIMDTVYQKIKQGEDFEKLAFQYSEDRRTAEQGGVIGWVTVGGRMIKEFEDAVFSLEKPGDIYPLLKTSYGYHLIKLLEIEPIKPFEEVKNEIKSKISSSDRTSKSRDAILKQLKAEYNYKTYPQNLKEVYDVVTDSIFSGSWKLPEDLEIYNKILVSFLDKNYTQADFLRYLEKFNRKQTPINLKIFIDNSLSNFGEKMLLNYEESILENKYPSFKYLVNEYHDGILLFDLTDKMVWSKAITDTVGLQNFYEANKDKYMWGTRIELKEYKCADLKTAKVLYKALNKKFDNLSVIDKLNKKNPETVVLAKSEIKEKNESSLKDKQLSDTPGSKYVFLDETNFIVRTIIIRGPEHKSLNEARGIITADYQNYLEQEWIKELKNKYTVTVNYDVLKSLAGK